MSRTAENAVLNPHAVTRCRSPAARVSCHRRGAARAVSKNSVDEWGAVIGAEGCTAMALAGRRYVVSERRARGGSTAGCRWCDIHVCANRRGHCAHGTANSLARRRCVASARRGCTVGALKVVGWRGRRVGYRLCDTQATRSSASSRMLCPCVRCTPHHACARTMLDGCAQCPTTPLAQRRSVVSAHTEVAMERASFDVLCACVGRWDTPRSETALRMTLTRHPRAISRAARSPDSNTSCRRIQRVRAGS